MVKSALPDPKGPLVEEIPSSLISAANKVLEILDKPPTAISAKKRAAYRHQYRRAAPAGSKVLH